ncbi:MAG: heme-binding domain-containing protein [Bacteroidetes bacterium]|nr:heme-binding domain-containing protein [Bacteroidota bacterium]
MGKELRIILLVLLAAFIVIQLIPANRPVNEQGNYDFFVENEVPEDVEEIIRNACYDCHSQEVYYPWYAYVAPASWQVAKDVRHGRNNLDFSKWNQFDKREKLNLLDEIGDEVGEGGMPLTIYTIIHPEAKLTIAERERVVNWSESLAEKVFEE